MPSKDKNSPENVVLEAKEAFQALLEISRLLNTQLDPETLTICVRLCEIGVNPEALADVIKEIRKEMIAINTTQE